MGLLFGLAQPTRNASQKGHSPITPLQICTHRNFPRCVFQVFPLRFNSPASRTLVPEFSFAGTFIKSAKFRWMLGITDLRRDAQLTKVCSPHLRSRPQRLDVPARPLPILENGKIASGKVISLASVYPWEHSFCFTFR